MKNALRIGAAVLFLIAGATLAAAQSAPGGGIVTGSAANDQARYHDGEYTGDRTYGGGLPLYRSERSPYDAYGAFNQYRMERR